MDVIQYVCLTLEDLFGNCSWRMDSGLAVLSKKQYF
jgi:hypothetical protein